MQRSPFHKGTIVTFVAIRQLNVCLSVCLNICLGYKSLLFIAQNNCKNLCDNTNVIQRKGSITFVAIRQWNVCLSVCLNICLGYKSL